jgi:hypothetical protein
MKKHFIWLAAVILFAFAACKKSSTTQIYTIDPGLKSGFAFKAGSYWIYKDSVSGEIDSVYVSGYSDNYAGMGCVPEPNVKYEWVNYHMTVVPVSNSKGVSADEVWTVTMHGKVMLLSLANNDDSIENNEIQVTLAQYPFALGYYKTNFGCLLYGYFDSSYVPEIISSYEQNGNSYSNTAVSAHQNAITDARSTVSSLAVMYQDAYYLCPGTGLVKVVFDHPAEGIHRVLQLQRYKIL